MDINNNNMEIYVLLNNKDYVALRKMSVILFNKIETFVSILLRPGYFSVVLDISTI